MPNFYNSSNSWIGVTQNYGSLRAIPVSGVTTTAPTTTILQPDYNPKPTTKDDQCHVNFFPSGSWNPICWATDRSNPNLNLDSKTCTYYKGKCYSNTAKQCTKSSDCRISWTGECVNNNGGSNLNCRHAGFLGSCTCVSK